jgi:hypothetical protein
VRILFFAFLCALFRLEKSPESKPHIALTRIYLSDAKLNAMEPKGHAFEAGDYLSYQSLRSLLGLRSNELNVSGWALEVASPLLSAEEIAVLLQQHTFTQLRFSGLTMPSATSIMAIGGDEDLVVDEEEDDWSDEDDDEEDFDDEDEDLEDEDWEDDDEDEVGVEDDPFEDEEDDEEDFDDEEEAETEVDGNKAE